MVVFSAVFIYVQASLLGILGTIVLTAAATMLAALKFSEDLQKSTTDQIAALRDVSRQEVQAAQTRADESAKALRAGLDETLKLFGERFDQQSTLLATVARGSEESRERVMQLLEEQRKAREAEEERFRRDQERLAEEARMKLPGLSIRITERPVVLPIVGKVVDYWLDARNDTPIKTLRVRARSWSAAKNVSGRWLSGTRTNLTVPVEIPLIKIGGLGVRGVHDSIEIDIDVVTGDDARYFGQLVGDLGATNWMRIAFQRVA